MDELIVIGAEKQFFIDDYVLEALEGTAQVMNQPQKDLSNPLIVADRPWEGTHVYLYKGTTLFDRDRGLYRMWYQVYDPEHAKHMICYARSEDGLHWEKPDLGVVEYAGSRENNIVFAGNRYAANVNVLDDAHETDPSRRYKLLYWDRGPKGGPSGICVAFSPDGIHFTPHPDNPVLSGTGDTHFVYGWDERYGQYVGYFRPTGKGVPLAGSRHVRTIGRSLSPDFVHWTYPQIVLQPDANDPPDTQFYCMTVFPYDGLYLGFIAVFATNSCQMRSQLAVNRDGILWRRVKQGTPFLPLGSFGSFDGAQMYLNAPMRVGDELWIYYGGFATRHSYRSEEGAEGVAPASSIGLARLRPDGFVTVDAGPNVGTATTKPLVFSGQQLAINAWASFKQSAGVDDSTLVQVEILDGEGRPLPGYGAEENDSLTAGELGLRQVITWQGNADVGRLAGLPIKLRFHLRNVKLCSFQFES